MHFSRQALMHFLWTFLHFLLQRLEVCSHFLLQRLEVCLHPLLHCFRPSGHGDCGDEGGCEGAAQSTHAAPTIALDSSAEGQRVGSTT